LEEKYFENIFEIYTNDCIDCIRLCPNEALSLSLWHDAGVKEKLIRKNKI
jgi:hypothetical protein